MQDSQLRWMIGLSLLVLVLVTALSFELDDGDPVDPDATGVVIELDDIDAVQRIEREVRGERLVLAKADDGWAMVEPDAALADSFVVERFLDDLREMDRGVPIELDGEELDAFGLGDPPAARIRLTLSDGTEIDATYGEPAPVGYRTYALDREGAVVAVGGQSDLLLEPSSAFRDHRLLRIDPRRVRRVSLFHDGHELTVRGEGLEWWVDGFTRADPDRVDDLILGLMDLRYDRIMNFPDAIAEPEARVELELEGSEVVELKVGERTPMGDRVDTDTLSGMVFPESLALLGMGPTDIGDRHAIDMSLEADDRVQVEIGEVSWEATRDGTRWRSAGLDEAQTWNRVNGLAQASIAYQLDPVEPPESVWATVTVWRGDTSRSIEIGPAREDGFHRVRDVRGGEPYRVRASELEALGG